MSSKLTIRIKKRKQPEYLILLIVFLPFLFGVLLDFMLLPNALKYVLDLAWVVLLALMFMNLEICKAVTRSVSILIVGFIVFVLATFVIYIFNYQSVFYYLWGVRNNFRFFVLFFACIIFLKREDANDFLKFFEIFFWVNAIITAVQYFAFGIEGDKLGGVFGSTVGCNRYTNLFFGIITAKAIIYYLNKQEKLWSLILKSGVMMVIAALAEIKFFYIEFVIIIIAAVLLTDFSVRNVIVIVGGLIAASFGAFLLVRFFPDSAGFLSLEGIMEIAASEKGYTSSGDLNRLTALSTISNDFLTTIPKKLFGLGLGNCDMAAYDFLMTPFYRQYSFLRYDWFSHAFLFLETGYMGLLFHFGFYIFVFIKAIKKTAILQKTMYNQIAAIVAICCIINTFYNASLRSEAGYMAYFVLALPFL